MRRIALFVVFLLCSPAFAEAQAPANLDTICKGSTGDPKGGLLIPEGMSSARVKEFLQRKVLCPSACFDVTMKVGVSTDPKGILITVTSVDTCKTKPDYSKITSVFSKLPAPNENRNCQNGKGLPSITVISEPVGDGTKILAKIGGYTIPKVFETARKEGPKSRCDTRTVQVIEAFSNTTDKQNIDNGFNSLSSLLTPSQPPEVTPTGPLPGGSEITKAFDPQQTPATNLESGLTKLGIDGTKAKEMVANNPQGAVDLLNAYASGDPEAIKRESAKLGLNPDLDKVATIQDHFRSEIKNPDQYTGEVKEQRANVTFGETPAPQQPEQKAPPGGKYGPVLKQIEEEYKIDGKTSGVLAHFFKIESRGNCNAISPTGPAGCYQYAGKTWDYWSAQINGGVPLPRELRHDIEVSSRVTANYIATNLRKYGDIIDQSGINPVAAVYAVHNIGDGGGPKFLREYARDPDQLVRNVLDPVSIHNNPLIYSGGNITLRQAEQNMLAAMSGSTNFVGGTVTRTMGSPFAGNTTFGPQPYFMPPTPYGVSPSPFGNVTPVGYSVPTSYAPTSYTPATAGITNGGVTSGTPTGGGGTITGGGNTQTPTQTAHQSATPAAGTIIAVPKELYKGGRIFITWSSVGTSQSVPCGTFLSIGNGTESLVARGNDGSKSIVATSTGTYKFALKCVSVTGLPLQQATTVLVK